MGGHALSSESSELIFFLNYLYLDDFYLDELLGSEGQTVNVITEDVE